MISNSKIELYVADSESSAIRSINMKTLKASRLLVGGDFNPKNLHAYGDQDGSKEDAKLQHPLGLTFIPEKNVVAVTDTYNHKIKVIDPFNNEIYSWLGNGESKLQDALTFDCSLNEPSGICSLYDQKEKDIKVFIADCNNHCIRYCYYDQGVLHTPTFTKVPMHGTDVTDTNPKEDEEEFVKGKKNKPNKEDNKLVSKEDQAMDLECIGDRCYPKFK